jgi:acylphosphatase
LSSPDTPGTSRPSQTVRVHVIVEGRVQGVFFRGTAHHLAAGRGVAGWVRNLPDGRVEAVYEGRQDAVDELVTWTRRGPERALVTGVEIHVEAPKGERGFIIR